MYFPKPRNWRRWEIYANEERKLWHAERERAKSEGYDPVRLTSLYAPDGARPPSIWNYKNLLPWMRNPWWFADPIPGGPPLRLYGNSSKVHLEKCPPPLEAEAEAEPEVEA